MPFQQFGLPTSLVRNVLALGYKTPTPIQAQAIPLVQTGRDLIATAQTGTGKTAAFLLPVLQQLLDRPRGTTGALVLTPTRELAQQIDSVFRGIAKGAALRSALVIGGAPERPQTRALQSGVDLVIATPGRLLAQMRDFGAKLPELQTLILDEADQMFDLGFFPDLKQIIARLPNRKQTLLFSATMPPDVAKLGQSILRDPQTVSTTPQGTVAEGVSQTAYPVTMNRKSALLEHLLEQLERPSVLVFTRTKRDTKKLTQRLYDAGHSVAELHGDRSTGQRLRAMQSFRNRAVPIMVATNIAARGLDVRHITHVVNFDVPATTEEYVHRIGRTGRAGAQGEAYVLVSPEEEGMLRRIERHLGKRIERNRLPEFNYGVEPEPREEKRPRKRFAAVTAAVPGKRKVSRGQGGRRR